MRVLAVAEPHLGLLFLVTTNRDKLHKSMDFTMNACANLDQ